MAEVGKTVEGIDGENWNSWLVSDKKEILDIKKPKLQTHLRLLARRDDGMNTPDYLQEVHTNLEKMIIENEISLEEAAPWMLKIEGRHKFLVEKEDNKKSKSAEQKIEVVLPEIERPSGHIGRLDEKILKMKKEGASEMEWGKVVLEEIDFAETESDKERKKSSKDEKPEYWDAIEKAIQEIPNNLGSIDKKSDLAKFLSKEHKNGLTFKDRLTILFTARKHLNDRFIEMSRAGGSLTKMGVSDEMPFEGISYKVQTISPEDFEMLFHSREFFPELAKLPITELRELLPDLDKASCKWLDVGIKNSSIPKDIMTNEEVDIIYKILNNKNKITTYYSNEIDKKTKEFEKAIYKGEELKDKKEELEGKIRGYRKNMADTEKMSIDSNWLDFKVFIEPLMEAKILERDDILVYAHIPTFDNSLNNATTEAELRKRMTISLRSSKAEDLAFRVLTNTLTFEMLDRGRSSVQGSSEPRDIMWIERKRLFEMKQEREPGLDWTVHRYFVTRPDPGDVIKENDEKKLTSKKLIKRREMLEINAERGIYVEGFDYFEGEIVSDFFHNAMIFAPDELKTGENIRRNLATYVLNGDGSVKKGGFKEMPFLKMGPESYSTAGYWGYTIAKAKQLATEISTTTYKKADEELVTDDWWNKKRDLFGRLEHVSPRLITIEFQTRGEEIRKLLKKDKRFNEQEINKILGFSEASDLNVILDPSLRNEALGIITDPLNNIAKRAKEKADEKRRVIINRFRLVHALGVVWSGSLDAIETTSTALSGSAIQPNLLNKITMAIVASRYLEGIYLKQFKHETEEMGFGMKVVKRKIRFRQPLNKSLWD